jgi:DNA recombination protein RmuC
MTEHVKALRGHIDALAKKEYWEGLTDSPDLVIAFIPSESLLSSALEFDPGLLDYAFRKNVAVASPVTLWAVLKTVAYSWRQESLTADAKKLFDLGKELYKRISTLADYSEALRRSIEATVGNYNKFSASLETRVLVTARKLNDAGDPTLHIVESHGIDESPKALTAPELLADLTES